MAALPVLANDYPNRPVKLVLGYSAGGTMDTIARFYASELSRSLGQPFVVENRSGANGTLAAQKVVQSPNDGYTLHMTASATQVLTPMISPSLPYVVERDFIQVASVAQVPLVMTVDVSHPANTVKEFLTWLKTARNPSFGSSGAGQSLHLAGLMLQESAGVELTHIPFKGEAPALTELMGGRISTVFATRSGAIPLIKANRLKALAVTDVVRSTELPNVPTTAEAGVPDIEMKANYMFTLKAGTPPSIAKRLEDAILAIAKDPLTAEKMASLGLTPTAQGAREAELMLKREVARFRPLVSKYKITLE